MTSTSDTASTEKATARPWRLAMGEVCVLDQDGNEGISYEQALIEFEGDDPDSEREILVNSPGAPKIAERIVRAVNRDAAFDAVVKALKFAEVALVACANILRPSYPNIANAVIPAHLKEIRAAIALAKSTEKAEGGGHRNAAGFRVPV